MKYNNTIFGLEPATWAYLTMTFIVVAVIGFGLVIMSEIAPVFDEILNALPKNVDLQLTD